MLLLLPRPFTNYPDVICLQVTIPAEVRQCKVPRPTPQRQAPASATLQSRRQAFVWGAMAGFVVRASVNAFLPDTFCIGDLKCSIVLVNDISGEFRHVCAIACACTFNEHFCTSRHTCACAKYAHSEYGWRACIVPLCCMRVMPVLVCRNPEGWLPLKQGDAVQEAICPSRQAGRTMQTLKLLSSPSRFRTERYAQLHAQHLVSFSCMYAQAQTSGHAHFLFGDV